MTTTAAVRHEGNPVCGPRSFEDTPPARRHYGDHESRPLTNCWGDVEGTMHGCTRNGKGPLGLCLEKHADEILGAIHGPVMPAWARCLYCKGDSPECGFCEMGKPLDTDWDKSWGKVLSV